MATANLSKLKVSLTKHNAHKVAVLLRRYSADQILDHLDEVRAERAQTYKNLSVQADGGVPDVWRRVQALGTDAIDGLLFIAIIFSHHALIDAMRSATSRSRYAGRIERGNQLRGKEYTNFARVTDQLGYATELTREGFGFNLQPLFQIAGFGPLVKAVLELKLRSAGWDGSNTVSDEALALDIHRVFGIKDREFRSWLNNGVAPQSAGSTISLKDEEFFQLDNDRDSPPHLFTFRPGHIERSVEPTSREPSPRLKAARLHNEIQNCLYDYLRHELGDENVGTEMNTGYGTSVDLATRSSDCITFYEIKTAESVRASIRQAIPQLLEYAYWPHEKRAGRLVIVSHLRLTNSAKHYLQYLRDLFDIPIFYQQFHLKQKKLMPAY